MKRASQASKSYNPCSGFLRSVVIMNGFPRILIVENTLSRFCVPSAGPCGACEDPGGMVKRVLFTAVTEEGGGRVVATRQRPLLAQQSLDVFTQRYLRPTHREKSR